MTLVVRLPGGGVGRERCLRLRGRRRGRLGRRTVFVPAVVGRRSGHDGHRALVTTVVAAGRGCVAAAVVAAVVAAGRGCVVVATGGRAGRAAVVIVVIVAGAGPPASRLPAFPSPPWRRGSALPGSPVSEPGSAGDPVPAERAPASVRCSAAGGFATASPRETPPPSPEGGPVTANSATAPAATAAVAFAISAELGGSISSAILTPAWLPAIRPTRAGGTTAVAAARMVLRARFKSWRTPSPVTPSVVAISA